MSQKAETGLYRRIKRYVENEGGLCFKIHGSAMQEAGVPDIIGWIPVSQAYKTQIVHFAVELKMPGNDASKLQMYQLRRWGAGGFKSGIAESLDDFKRIIYD